MTLLVAAAASEGVVLAADSLVNVIVRRHTGESRSAARGEKLFQVFGDYGLASSGQNDQPPPVPDRVRSLAFWTKRGPPTNFDDVLRAVREYFTAMSDVTLLLAGVDRDRPRIERMKAGTSWELTSVLDVGGWWFEPQWPILQAIQRERIFDPACDLTTAERFCRDVIKEAIGRFKAQGDPMTIDEPIDVFVRRVGEPGTFCRG